MLPAHSSTVCFHFLLSADQPVLLVMAEELDSCTTFTPGQVVTCTTCFDQDLEGEVVAFDYERRVLVIKTPSAQQPTHHDVHLVNTDCVSGIDIKKEAKNSIQAPQKIEVRKVSM